jgi:phosphate transport system ATP-binding protein
MQQAQRTADYTAYFHMGKMVEYNSTEQLFKQPQQELTQSYLSGRFG